ncbi:MAG: 50S ribosomal protein L18 [Balneolaceae bacterium]
MDRNRFKKERRNKIRRRIRSTIRGTAERPRFSVFKSSKHVYLQLNNDRDGVTILSNSTLSSAHKDELKGKSALESARYLGEELAKAAKERGIEKVVFDRGGYKYHGIVKAAADGAREGGLDL